VSVKRNHWHAPPTSVSAGNRTVLWLLTFNFDPRRTAYWRRGFYTPHSGFIHLASFVRFAFSLLWFKPSDLRPVQTRPYIGVFKLFNKIWPTNLEALHCEKCIFPGFYGHFPVSFLSLYTPRTTSRNSGK